ncbi:MAG: hypothetical protein IKU08_06655 [Clostridia bacterium]|nr:hypothetical protein [Clostridia bacterium]
MKKFLAIVFSLIFALSAFTVAFAAENTCPYCKDVIADEVAYNEHISGGCDVKFRSCKYGCGAKFSEAANLEVHEDACPKGAGNCEYCDAAYANQAAYEAHKENECKIVTTVGEDAAPVVDKVIDTLKTVNWEALANKIVDAVKSIDIEGLIAKIKPVIEKVVSLVKDYAA